MLATVSEENLASLLSRGRRLFRVAEFFKWHTLDWRHGCCNCRICGHCCPSVHCSS